MKVPKIVLLLDTLLLINMFDKLSTKWSMGNNSCYYTFQFYLLYKSNKTIWMFYGKFADERDNPGGQP
jgi:hypothetical protein